MKPNDKGIPVPGIPLDLVEDTPSKVDPKELRKDLHNIGLTCEKTDVKVLTETIKEVASKFRDGTVQGFGFSKFHALSQESYLSLDTSGIELNSLVEELPISANWKPKDTVPYSDKLYVIAFPSHFDWLQSTGFFSGQKSSNKYTGFGTLEALKTQFVQVATNISATLVSGIDKDLMQACFTKIIEPVSDVTDYSKTVNRSILLIDNYDETTRQCDGLGILNVEYRIYIEDYKDKKGNNNGYNLDITVRTVLYSNPKAIIADYERVRGHFKDKMFFDNALAIPVPTRIDVFKKFPKPCSATFLQGIPQTQQSADHVDVIVLFEADLRLICSHDNTASDASTTYQESVTTGFTFSAGQKISISSSCSIDVIVAKSTTSLSLEVNFNEQWNESHTKSISVTVPGRKKAHLYQASIRSRILRLNLETLEYKYLPAEGVFTADRFVTVENLIQDHEKAIMKSLDRNDTGGRLPLWLRVGQTE